MKNYNICLLCSSYSDYNDNVVYFKFMLVNKTFDLTAFYYTSSKDVSNFYNSIKDFISCDFVIENDTILASPSIETLSIDEIPMVQMNTLLTNDSSSSDITFHSLLIFGAKNNFVFIPDKSLDDTNSSDLGVTAFSKVRVSQNSLDMDFPIVHPDQFITYQPIIKGLDGSLSKVYPFYFGVPKDFVSNKQLLVCNSIASTHGTFIKTAVFNGIKYDVFKLTNSLFVPITEQVSKPFINYLANSASVYFNTIRALEYLNNYIFGITPFYNNLLTSKDSVGLEISSGINRLDMPKLKQTAFLLYKKFVNPVNIETSDNISPSTIKEVFDETHWLSHHLERILKEYRNPNFIYLFEKYLFSMYSDYAVVELVLHKIRAYLLIFKISLANNDTDNVLYGSTIPNISTFTERIE